MATNNDQIILNQILQERKQEVAPLMNDTDDFELFAAEQILKEYDLSYDEIQLGIVDGGGEGGIDALYLFINGEIIFEDSDLPTPRKVFIELHVIQAKSSAGFSEVAV